MAVEKIIIGDPLSVPTLAVNDYFTAVEGQQLKDEDRFFRVTGQSPNLDLLTQGQSVSEVVQIDLPVDVNGDPVDGYDVNGYSVVGDTTQTAGSFTLIKKEDGDVFRSREGGAIFSTRPLNTPNIQLGIDPTQPINASKLFGVGSNTTVNNQAFADISEALDTMGRGAQIVLPEGNIPLSVGTIFRSGTAIQASPSTVLELGGSGSAGAIRWAPKSRTGRTVLFDPHVDDLLTVTGSILAGDNSFQVDDITNITQGMMLKVYTDDETLWNPARNRNKLGELQMVRAVEESGGIKTITIYGTFKYSYDAINFPIKCWPWHPALGVSYDGGQIRGPNDATTNGVLGLDFRGCLQPRFSNLHIERTDEIAVSVRASIGGYAKNYTAIGNVAAGTGYGFSLNGGARGFKFENAHIFGFRHGVSINGEASTGGVVRDIHYKNVLIEGTADATTGSMAPGAGVDQHAICDDILYENVHVRNIGGNAFTLEGASSTLIDCSIDGAGGGVAVVNYTSRPSEISIKNLKVRGVASGAIGIQGGISANGAISSVFTKIELENIDIEAMAGDTSRALFVRKLAGAPNHGTLKISGFNAAGFEGTGDNVAEVFNTDRVVLGSGNSFSSQTHDGLRINGAQMVTGDAGDSVIGNAGRGGLFLDDVPEFSISGGRVEGDGAIVRAASAVQSQGIVKGLNFLALTDPTRAIRITNVTLTTDEPTTVLVV